LTRLADSRDRSWRSRTNCSWPPLICRAAIWARDAAA
jgi:hypothetical protein